MADKKHDDRVTEIAGGQNADEAPQVFKVGQMGSGRREFLKNALAGAAAGVSAATIGGCNPNPHSSQRGSKCSATWVWAHGGAVSGPVNALAIRSDSKLLASASSDQTIKLWSLPDGALLKTLRGHTGSVSAVAISPDGTLLASGSADETVRLWSLPDGALLKTLVGNFASVTAVGISPNGTLLASVSRGITVPPGFDDGTVKLLEQ